MSRILVDTNILVYAYDRSEDEKGRRALAVLTGVHEQHVMLLSAQVLAELYWVVTRKLTAPVSENEATEILVAFSAACEVLPVTAAVVLDATRAVKEHRLSYWDAQLWATARAGDAGVVLTEDLQDGRTIEGVRIVNPLRDGFSIDEL